MKCHYHPKGAVAVRMLSVLLLVILLTFFLMWICFREDRQGDAGKFALLVGCTEYPELLKTVNRAIYDASIRLDGPANDVELMREMLIEHLNFADENITILAGKGEREPTLKNIFSHLDRLSATVQEGNQVVILLAGHGCQQPDLDGDELDGRDEVFLPSNVASYRVSDRIIPNALTDDEILVRVQKIRDAGAFVWIIIDACYSGTMVRGAEPLLRYRAIDPELLDVDFEKIPHHEMQKNRTSSLDFEDLNNIVAFYAAQSFHKTPEMPLPDHGSEIHGLFSYMIARQLERHGGRQTFDNLMANLIVAYQALPYAMTVPFAEGDLRRTIGGSEAGDAPPLFLHMEGGMLSLNGGRLTALEQGTILDIYRPGQTDEAPIGRVKIIEAKLFQSACEVMEGDELRALEREAPSGAYPARVYRRPEGDYSLKVSAVSATNKPIPLMDLPPYVQDCFRQYDRGFHFVEEFEKADWLLVLEDNDLWLEPAKSGGNHNRFDLGRGGLYPELKKIFWARNLKRLAGSGHYEDIDPDLHFEVLKRSAGGREQRVQREGDRLRPGEQVRAVLTRNTDRIFDVWVLFIDANNGINHFYPRFGETPRLSHMDLKSVAIPRNTANGEPNWVVVTDQPLGAEHLLVIAFPREENSDQIDLSWLVQDSLQMRTRGSGADDFSRLLDQLKMDARTRGQDTAGVDPLSPKISLFTWQTQWPPAAPPSSWLGQTPVQLPPRAGNPATDIPDPWAIGPRVALACSAPGIDPDLLLGGDELPAQILIDEDGDSPEGLALEMAVDKRFDAEAAFHFLDDRKIAFYDTNNDGDFDLILVDNDEDRSADILYERKDGSWITKEDVEMPWLSTEYLAYLEKFPVQVFNSKVKDAIRRFSVVANER